MCGNKLREQLERQNFHFIQINNRTLKYNRKRINHISTYKCSKKHIRFKANNIVWILRRTKSTPIIILLKRGATIVITYIIDYTNYRNPSNLQFGVFEVNYLPNSLRNSSSDIE